MDAQSPRTEPFEALSTRRVPAEVPSVAAKPVDTRVGVPQRPRQRRRGECILTGRRPTGEGGFDVGAARTARERPSASRCPCDRQHRGARRRNCGHLATRRTALRVVQAVETPEVQDKAKAGAHAGGPERRDLASTSRTSTPACRARSRAARRALGAISMPVTCHPRRASATDCMPVLQPRSRARP
jgi:hypothetical protein